MRISGIRSMLVGAPLFGVGAGARAHRVLYGGGSSSTSGVRLGGWGSGTAIDSPTEGYGAGAHSLKVSVDGYYSGGRITFENPIDITDDVTNPNAFLEFVIQFQQGRIQTAST